MTTSEITSYDRKNQTYISSVVEESSSSFELLEAEQEKFILGVTPAYRCYDVSDEDQC